MCDREAIAKWLEANEIERCPTRGASDEDEKERDRVHVREGWTKNGRKQPAAKQWLDWDRYGSAF